MSFHIMEESQFLVSCSAVIEMNGRYLLVRPLIDGKIRDPKFPMDTQSNRESIREACLRIAKEWTGLDVIVTGVLSIHSRSKFIHFNLLASCDAEELPQLPEGSPYWVLPEELREMIENKTGTFGGPSSLLKAPEILLGKSFPLSLFEPSFLKF